MIRKGQRKGDEVEGLSVVEQFYALASSSPHQLETVRLNVPIHPNLRRSPCTPLPVG